MNKVLAKFALSASVYFGMFVMALFICAPILTVNAASIRYEDACTIVLDGEIDKFTELHLRKAYDLIPKGCGTQATLHLNSTGGDVDAAMRASYFVREKGIKTWINQNKSCASACVLLFVAGVERFTLGRIGLHRPYSEKYSFSRSEATDSYEKINNRIRQYLREMNIPEGLLDKMNSVPPGKIEWLETKHNTPELIEMHIVGTDPVWEDQQDSAKAKKLGISKKELYTREQRAETICSQYSDKFFESERYGELYGNCYWDVISGRR